MFCILAKHKMAGRPCAHTNIVDIGEIIQGYEPQIWNINNLSNHILQLNWIQFDLQGRHFLLALYIIWRSNHKTGEANKMNSTPEFVLGGP